MRRAIWARLLNLVVPGSGMILLRREWLGFVAAILFSLLAALAIVGRWVVPRDVPPLLVAVSGWAAVGVWGLTQWLVHRRARWLASPALARELAVMRAQAAEALAEGDHMEAHRVLLVARSVGRRGCRAGGVVGRVDDRDGPAARRAPRMAARAPVG
jgi:hypothetical protein